MIRRCFVPETFHGEISMNKIALLLLLAMGPLHAAAAADCVDRDDLVAVLKTFSDKTGVQFILDPRVASIVNFVGPKRPDIDGETLLGILAIHGYTAFSNGKVVYVVPEAVVNNIGSKLGEPWDG